MVMAESSDHHLALVARSFQHDGADIVIQRRDSDGYFYGTRMCTGFGKRLPDYLKTQPTNAYMDALAGSICLDAKTIPNTTTVVLDFDAVRGSLVIVQRGGAHPGSWVHPRLAVDLGRWLMPAFAVWIDGWILEAMMPGLSAPSAAVPRQLKLALELRARPDGVDAAAHKMHCYAALVEGDGAVSDDGRVLFKIGCGNDPTKRAEAARGEVKRAHRKDWRFTLFRVFQEVGQAMETLLHRKFGVQAYGQAGFSEYFWGNPDTLAQDVDDAFTDCVPQLIQHQYQCKREAAATLKAGGDDEIEGDHKRRRLDLTLRREEIVVVEAETAAASAKAAAETAAASARAAAETAAAIEAANARVDIARADAQVRLIEAQADADVAKLRAGAAVVLRETPTTPPAHGHIEDTAATATRRGDSVMVLDLAAKLFPGVPVSSLRGFLAQACRSNEVTSFTCRRPMTVLAKDAPEFAKSLWCRAPSSWTDRSAGLAADEPQQEPRRHS